MSQRKWIKKFTEQIIPAEAAKSAALAEFYVIGSKIMTSFARYYKDRKLEVVTMENMKKYILDEANKLGIAEAIYHRYYERYLKLFFYRNTKNNTYCDENGVESIKNEFNTEYKNGFLIMASCSLLIETLASYLNGDDKTPRGESPQAFERIFNKAEEYSNLLSEFKNKKYYQNVRCAILHQGETYSEVKIKRTGPLFDEQKKEINASKLGAIPFSCTRLSPLPPCFCPQYAIFHMKMLDSRLLLVYVGLHEQSRNRPGAAAITL